MNQAKQKAEKKGETFTPTKKLADSLARYEKNIYSTALIYPLDRGPETPLNFFTPVDIMRETLGQEPCEYILDLEGIKPRHSSGQKDYELVDNATCTLWKRHIFPRLGKLKGLEEKKDTLSEEKKKYLAKEKGHLVRAIKDIPIFLRAVHDRIKEYDAFNEKLFAECEKAKGNKETAQLAERIHALSAAMRKMLGKGGKKSSKVDGYQKQVEKWEKDVVEMAAKVEAGDIEAGKKAGGSRTLGQNQDNVVSDCRRYVKAIRSEASFVEGSSAAERELGAEIRKQCQEILRNSHPKEMLNSDR